MLQCLFSWLYYCNIDGINYYDTDNTASMLVFLALLLQPRLILSLLVRRKQCFNACFPGSITATLSAALPKIPHHGFNACFPGSITATGYNIKPTIIICCASMLVFLALLLQLVTSYSTYHVSTQLQCLFSWLYYCNHRRAGSLTASR